MSSEINDVFLPGSGARIDLTKHIDSKNDQ